MRNPAMTESIILDLKIPGVAAEAPNIFGFPRREIFPLRNIYQSATDFSAVTGT